MGPCMGCMGHPSLSAWDSNFPLNLSGEAASFLRTVLLPSQRQSSCLLLFDPVSARRLFSPFTSFLPFNCAVSPLSRICMLLSPIITQQVAVGPWLMFLLTVLCPHQESGLILTYNQGFIVHLYLCVCVCTHAHTHSGWHFFPWGSLSTLPGPHRAGREQTMPPVATLWECGTGLPWAWTALGGASWYLTC